MSTDVVSFEAHLSPAERQALINRLREFGHQQEESQELSDRGSLDRAADLMKLYEDKSWMDELPAPGRRSKVPADDFRRFVKWALEDDRLELKRKYISQLKKTDEVHAVLSSATTNLHGVSGSAIRPLGWMLREGYADRIDEVWRDVVQLADGRVPSESEVKRALKDWKDRNLPKTEKEPGAPKVKGNRAKVDKLRADAERLLYEVPQLAAPVLRELLAKYEEHKASLPPMEEWS